MAKSIQEFIERNRPPRVQVSYKLDTTGDVKVELPFIVGVMGNFKGKASETPIDQREFSEIDQDNIAEKMAKMDVGLDLDVNNTLAKDGSTLAVKLKFDSMKKFRPGAIAEQVPELKELLDRRKLLSDLKAKTGVEAERRLGELLALKSDEKDAAKKAVAIKTAAGNLTQLLAADLGPKQPPKT